MASGCFSNPFLNSDALLTESQRKELLEYQREVEIGRNMTGHILQFYGSNHNEKIKRYLNQIALYLGEHTDAKERRYMVALLDTKSVNVFACPGGYILLTMGALENMKNEAELAGVLGHAIAHIEKKHLLSTLLERSKTLEKPIEIDPILKARQRNLGRLFSDPGQNILHYISGDTGEPAALDQATKEGLSILFETGLDKTLEYEADQKGMQIMVRANYDPFALMNFLSRVDKNKNTDTKNLETTHPLLKDRVAALGLKLEQMRAKDILAAEGETRFRKRTQALRK